MKIARERPDLWRVIVTIIVMIYLGVGSASILHTVFLASSPDYQDPQSRLEVHRLSMAAGVIFVLIWAFLISDLAKQISLFAPRRNE